MGMRITGLGPSGMDIDQTVKEIMKAQRARYDKLSQNKTQIQWKKTDYNTIYSNLNDFRSKTVFNFKLQSTLLPRTAASADELVVGTTASSDAVLGSHSIEVIQLAEGVKKVSSGSITAAGNKKDTLAAQFGVSGKFTVRVGNGDLAKEIVVDSSKSIYDFAKSINNAGINVSASYDANLDRMFISTSNTGEAANLNFGGSSSVGLDFITNKLKLDVPVNTVDENGMTSSGPVAAVLNVDATLNAQFGTTGTFEIIIKNRTSNTTVKIDAGTDTLSTFISKINSAGVNAQASYDSFTGKVTMKALEGALDFTGSEVAATSFLQNTLKLPAGTISTTDTTSSDTLTAKVALVDPLNTKFTGLPAGIFNLNINGSTIPIDPNGTMQDFITAIKLNLNVDAVGTKYDETTGVFTLKAAAGKTLNFTGSDSAAIDLLANKFKITGLTKQTGKDAIVNLDGMDGIHEANNNFTVCGVTYNLKKKNIGSPLNVVVSSDTETIIKNVKSFVEEYNKTIGLVNGELNEAKYKGFLPLTDDQKKDMKEADVKLWEEKAKSGMLRRDPILQQLVNEMRSAISMPIAGLSNSYTSASSIGISTISWQEGGKLYLNETKLRDALSNDPQIVNKIFGSGTGDTQGIATRLYDTLKTAADKIVTEAGATASTTTDKSSNIAKRINDYEKNMDAMQRRLQDMEDSYYRKFTAMETALQRLSKQSSWLNQQQG